MKQKKSGMVMSIGKQLPHMLTPFSFISFVCSAWKRLGSLAYFFLQPLYFGLHLRHLCGGLARFYIGKYGQRAQKYGAYQYCKEYVAEAAFGYGAGKAVYPAHGFKEPVCQKEITGQSLCPLFPSAQ